MSSFKTVGDFLFTLNLKTKDITAVRDAVKYPDGKPVDILEAAETGMLAGIYGSIRVFVDVMFILCLDQIKEHFDVESYDAANPWEYELHPERAKEPTVTKASRWFGSVIDGDTLIGMTEAFSEAVVNFTPNENRRSAMRAVLEKEREMERLEAEYRIKTVDLMYRRATENLGKRWENLGEKEAEELQNQLEKQFGSSGSTPESAG
jgi:hypothetical protein